MRPVGLIFERVAAEIVVGRDAIMLYESADYSRADKARSARDEDGFISNHFDEYEAGFKPETLAHARTALPHGHRRKAAVAALLPGESL